MVNALNSGVASLRSNLLHVALTVVVALNACSMVGQINACKYLIVTDFSSDPYGIAKELRRQARAQGFNVVFNQNETSQEDLFKLCVLSGTWFAQGFGGGISVRVLDAASGDRIAEAGTTGTNWWNVNRTVRKAVAKIYSQLGYAGFSEEAYERKIRNLYPRRPTLSITEEAIKKTDLHSHIEGIWSDPEDKYRIGIVPAPSGSSADYFAIILRSSSPIWQSGEIKGEFRGTASPDVFTCTYFMSNKKPAGTTFVIDHDAVLRGSAPTPTGSIDVTFFRVWPKMEAESARTSSPVQGGTSGTGFLLSRNGLVATNWHVVADAKHISFALPGWKEGVTADVVIRDVANDLAILRASDQTKLTTTCPDFPYQLASSNTVTLGEHVSTIGYPLTTFLGSSPKFSEGVVSSKSGMQDDPRSLQISAQVQPGSSGSPLFDPEGNIIGIIVATLDAGKLYQSANVLPQNVNWAIKSDYLMNLLGMLPGQSAASRTVPFTPEKAAQCVATISAW